MAINLQSFPLFRPCADPVCARAHWRRPVWNQRWTTTLEQLPKKWSCRFHGLHPPPHPALCYQCKTQTGCRTRALEMGPEQDPNRSREDPTIGDKDPNRTREDPSIGNESLKAPGCSNHDARGATRLGDSRITKLLNSAKGFVVESRLYGPKLRSGNRMEARTMSMYPQGSLSAVGN